MEQIQTFDVLVLGGPRSGKKTFAERLTKDKYDENALYNQNLGIETCERESIVDGRKILVNITVCSGRKRHLPIVQQFYDKIHAAIIMYDCSNVDSFRKEMIFWYNEIKRALPNAIIILVGAKDDINGQLRAIPAKDGDKQAQEFNVNHYVLSSKKNTQITEMWNDLISMMMDNQEKALASNSQKNDSEDTHKTEKSEEKTED